MLAEKIMKEGDEVVIEIARAFWEDEGSIGGEGNLIGEIKNEFLRNQLLHLHKRLGIWVNPYYDRCHNCYDIYVKRTYKNVKSFVKQLDSGIA